MVDDDYDMLETMERIGDSFVKALAKAARQADATNYRKLEEAFPEYWADYREKAKMLKSGEVKEQKS